jgi:hypothetical protein
MPLSLAGPTLVLAGLASLVVLAVAVTRPPVSRRTVRSLLPWMATAGLLRGLAPLVPPGGLIATLFAPPAPTLLTVVLLGVALLGGVAITRVTGVGDSAPFAMDWGWASCSRSSSTCCIGQSAYRWTGSSTPRRPWSS